jgi:hypothetical protein
MKRLLPGVLLSFGLSLSPASAEVQVFKCSFSNMNEIFFTLYDDGSQPRIGVSQGVGNKGYSFFDQATGTWVIVEMNAGQVPVTMTSINKKGEAVHSRQLNSLPDGDFVSPSQGKGSCVKSSIR